MKQDVHPVLEVLDLKTWFPVKRGIFARTRGYVRAVDGISLFIKKGESLGLVGESGCGKSTLGRTIMGLETPVAGTILFKGKKLQGRNKDSLRRLRMKMQMVFQDPAGSLNPKMSVFETITEGMRESASGRELENRARSLLLDVGLDPGALYRYPHEFSGGQRQRISIARALSVRPEFLVCDEPTSALDVSVQAQVINLLLNLRKRYGISYLFISHDLGVVKMIAHRVAVMYLGRIVEEGSCSAVINEPKHPYTQALVSAVLEPGIKKEKRVILPGETPSPINPPSGCRFHPRCLYRMERCAEEDPDTKNVSGRRVACHLYSSFRRV